MSEFTIDVRLLQDSNKDSLDYVVEADNFEEAIEEGINLFQSDSEWVLFEGEEYLITVENEDYEEKLFKVSVTNDDLDLEVEPY